MFLSTVHLDTDLLRDPSLPGQDDHNYPRHGPARSQDEFFGFYNMYTVTQDNFEYHQNQQLIYK